MRPSVAAADGMDAATLDADNNTNAASPAFRGPAVSSRAMSGFPHAASVNSTSTSATGSSLRERKTRTTAAGPLGRQGETGSTPSQVDGPDDDEEAAENNMPTLESTSTTPHPKWVAFALFSGAFAAMNGVFAKLTTSENTVSIANSINHLLPFLSADVLTLLLRGVFFGLNIASNAIMWILFTRALTSHPSTTKVSVVNTSANFTITAIMGALIFGEAVGGIGGIAGLALLVGGCVVLGAEEKKKEETVEGVVSIDTEAAEALLDEHGVESQDDLIDMDGEIKLVDADGNVTKTARTSIGILEGTETEEELQT